MTQVEAGILGLLTPGQRADVVDVMARVAEHLRNGTTDMAEQGYREPVGNYVDPERWQREMANIFRRRPLPLALSCELPEPGAYKALDACGVPVLVVRGADGTVRALQNVCRHRGAQVVPDGCGRGRRFSCPYHAWVYDQEGSLVGVYGEDTFGELDRGSHGLVALPCEERAGIVFVGLTPGTSLDLDAWLGPYEEILDALALGERHVFSRRYLDGPNWKITFDGYLESYHFQSLHRDTVFTTNYSNLMAADSWGPHQRVAFALRPMADVAAGGTPPETWDPAECIGPIYTVFPGLAIAGGWRTHTAVSLLRPGESVDRSRTEQLILLRQPPRDDAERDAAQAISDWFFEVVRDEDYATNFRVQRGAAAASFEAFEFGRNEVSLHHFHRWVDQFAGG